MKSFLVTLLLVLQTNFLMAEVSPGQVAPDFSLQDNNGQKFNLGELKGNYIVLEWFNKDCPFVKKHYSSNNMQELQKKYTDQGVKWLVINSSATGKQGHESDSESKKTMLERKASQTKYLMDSDGKVGMLYGAKTTPHIFIIDKNFNVVYTGAIDSIASSDISDIKEATNYVDNTFKHLFANKAVDIKSSKPYGCNVKY